MNKMTIHEHRSCGGLHEQNDHSRIVHVVAYMNKNDHTHRSCGGLHEQNDHSRIVHVVAYVNKMTIHASFMWWPS